MKYFDKDYINGNLSDKEAINREALYKANLDNVLKNVQNDLKDFITTVNLHDSILQKIEQKQKDLYVTLLYGDNIAGHYSMEISFTEGAIEYIPNKKIPFEIFHYEYTYDSMCHCSLINENGDELNISFKDIVICKTEMHSW